MGKVINGDCLVELANIETGVAQIIICDPPYNIGKDYGNNKCKMSSKEYIKWCKIWINDCVRILKDNGTMFIYGFSETLAEISANLPSNLNKKWIVWHYTNKTTPSLNFWQKSHESILVIYKETKVFNRDLVRVPYTDTYLKADGKQRANTIGRFSDGSKSTTYKVNPLGALPRDVIKIPSLAGGGKERVNHPTQKPLELCDVLIKSCKQEEGIVVIPFAGSGSECVVAKKHNLDFIAIELNTDYITLINNRLNQTSVVTSIQEPGFKFFSEHWKNCNSFKNFEKKPTQYEYYLQNDSSPEILEIVKMNSKVFGTICEKIVTEILLMSPRLSSQNDATFTFNNITYKFEIKCARFLKNTQDYMFQHIEPEYDFDYLLLCVVNFTKFDIFYLKKEKVLDLIAKNVIKKQGKQGYICRKKDIISHLVEIKDNLNEILI